MKDKEIEKRYKKLIDNLSSEELKKIEKSYEKDWKEIENDFTNIVKDFNHIFKKPW